MAVPVALMAAARPAPSVAVARQPTVKAVSAATFPRDFAEEVTEIFHKAKRAALADGR